MPAEMIVINPRHRKRAKGGARRRRRVAHARRNPRKRRKMTPLQAMYFGKGRRRASVARRNPRRRRRVSYARRNPLPSGQVGLAPPGGYRRRRRSSGGGSANAINMLTDTIIPAGVGAVGALAIDMLWGYLPIPATLKTGIAAPITRVAGAVGVGLLVGMLAGEQYGEEALAGAVTVTLYDLFKSTLQADFPNIPLGVYVNRGGGMGYYTSPALPVGRPNGMGVYVN